MDRAQQADDCGVSVIEWSDARFRIAYPAGVTADRDPVAASDRGAAEAERRVRAGRQTGRTSVFLRSE